jgi:uncharacterized protein
MSDPAEPAIFTIWIDADGAPKAVKEIVLRASERRKLNAVFVANRWLQLPRSPFVRMVQVGAGMDVADDYIAEHCIPDDLVITSDVPLAASVVEKGGVVLDPRGGVLTADNVRQRLAMRDFKEELRASGVNTGGPPPFGKAERQRFGNGLDRWLTARARR